MKAVSKLKNNRKGFSLIELLAVMIIVGALSAVAIAAATNAIGKSKKEKVKQNEKNVTMAAKMYVQNNRDLLPRNIGEEKLIKLSELKNKNYLKEDVTNEAGESCITESYVRVYKLSNSEYTYTTYLYCGDEKAPEKPVIATPVVSSITFNDGDKSSKKDESSNYISNVSTASFSFEIKGDKDEETEIYGYTYAILVKNNTGDWTEVYTSGTKSGKGRKSIKFTSEPLSSYIDITGYSTVKIRVDVINVLGGKITNYSPVTGEGQQFKDEVPPVCGKRIGQPANDDTENWISKKHITSDIYPRIISVECSDGDGSGCKRDLFSDSWPDQTEEYKYGTKNSQITIEDNAVVQSNGAIGEPNRTVCGRKGDPEGRIKVNADVQSPSVTIDIYNPATKEIETKNAITVKDSDVCKNTPCETMPKGKIESDIYKNKRGESMYWLNKDFYGQGVKFKVTITDNLYIYKYEWKTNASYIERTASDDKIMANPSATNPDGEIGYIVPDSEQSKYESEDYGPRTAEITVGFYEEGRRYGVLTVYDKAGNTTEIEIYANVDRTPPETPEVLYMREKSPEKYTGNADETSGNYIRESWSTEHIFVYVNKSQQRDDQSPTPENGVELSGWKEFRYIYIHQNGIVRNNINVTQYKYTTDDEKKAEDNFKGNYGFFMRDEGTHTSKMRSCDYAENCSEYRDKQNNPYPYVKIDTIAPVCSNVELVYPNGDPINTNSNDGKWTSYTANKDKSTSWLGFKDDFVNMTKADNNKRYAMVYAVCMDVNANKAKDETYASLCAGVDGTTTYQNPGTGQKKGYYQGKLSDYTDTQINDAEYYNRLYDYVRTGNADTNDTFYNRNLKYGFPYVLQAYYVYKQNMSIQNAKEAGPGKAGYIVDIAGNEANCGSDTPKYNVNIDYNRPTCTATTTKIPRSGGSEQSYNGKTEWVGYKYNIRYTTDGTDKSSTPNSGIWDRYSKFTTIYYDEVNTQNATTTRPTYISSVSPSTGKNMFDNGSFAYDSTGTRQETRLYIYDKAGNRSTNVCPGLPVKIDHKGPDCDVDAKSEGSSNNSFWSYHKEGQDYGSYDSEWLNLGYGVSVRSRCVDDEIDKNLDPLAKTKVGSGCKSDYHAKTWHGRAGELFEERRGSADDGGGYVITDKVDNETTCGTFLIRIDDQNPVCSISRSKYHSSLTQWNNRAEGVSVTTSCSDGRGSGCPGTSCVTSDGNSSYPSDCYYAATKSHYYTVDEDDVRNENNGGSLKIGYSGIVIDKVGNQDSCKADQKVWIDDADPKCTIKTEYQVVPSSGTPSSPNYTKPKGDDNWAQSAYIQGDCTDRGSGCETNWQNKLKDNFDSEDTNKCHTYDHKAEDMVGNTSDCPNPKYAVRVQVTKPTCGIYTVQSSNWATDTNDLWGNPNGVTEEFFCDMVSSTSAPLTSCTFSSYKGTGDSNHLSGTASNIKKGDSLVVEDKAKNKAYCYPNMSTHPQSQEKHTTSCSSCSAAGCAKYGEEYECRCTGKDKDRKCDKCKDCIEYNKSCCSCSSSPMTSYSSWTAGSCSPVCTDSSKVECNNRTGYSANDTSRSSYPVSSIKDPASDCTPSSVSPKPVATPMPTPKPSPSPSPSPKTDLSGLYVPCRNGTTYVYDSSVNVNAAPYNPTYYPNSNDNAVIGTISNTGVKKKDSDVYNAVYFQIIGDEGKYVKIKIHGISECGSPWSSKTSAKICANEEFYLYKSCYTTAGSVLDNCSCLG